MQPYNGANFPYTVYRAKKGYTNGQAVTASGGDYIGEEFDLFKGGSRSYKYFPFRYNYLTEGIYVALLDSLAQVSSPTKNGILGNKSMLNKASEISINNIGTPAPANVTVLKSPKNGGGKLNNSETKLKKKV